MTGTAAHDSDRGRFAAQIISGERGAVALGRRLI